MAPPHREEAGSESSRVARIGAFAAIYLIWGSTFLAIRYAVETLPPFLMMGVRASVAGAILLGWTRLRGYPLPRPREWVAALLVGALLFLGGHGALGWGETRVASGPAALILGTIPVWMVLLDWTRPGGKPPSARVAGGLVLGLIGVGLLVVPTDLIGGGRIDPVGALVLVAGAFLWAAGSIFARNAKLPRSAVLSTAMELLTGGALLLLAGLALGEADQLSPAAISARSVLALAYLIAFGSVVAFSAYVWLLKVSTPARVGSYAYANPVVAMLLGAFAGDGPMTIRTWIAAAATVAAVVLIHKAREQGKRR